MMKMKRKKKISIILLTVILIIMNSITVFAADDVEMVYTGGSDTAVFEFQPNVSFDYENLMPGDESSQSIKVSNESEDDIVLRLSTKELVNDEFLSQLELTIVEIKDGLTITLFEGKVPELLDENKVNYNSSRFGDGISRYYVALSDYNGGDEGEMLFTLKVPFDMDNAFQGATGSVDWAVYMDIANVEGVTETSQPGEEETTKGRLPVILGAVVTGDYFPLFVVAIILIVSGVVISIVSFRKTRKKSEV